MFPEETAKSFESLESPRAAHHVPTVRREAHTLKSMCQMFNASLAAGLALELEKTAEAGTLGSDQQVKILKAELTAAAEAVMQFQKLLVPAASR